jgi:hypothetical protein
VQSIPSASGSCALVIDTAFLQIDSCQTLIIDSVGSSIKRFTYQRSLPDTIFLNYHQSLPFVFDPRDTSGTFTSNVQLFGHYLGSNVPYNQSFSVTLTAQPSPPELISAKSSVSFPNLMLCMGYQPVDTTIVFRNQGCSPDTLTNIGLTGANFLFLDSLPIIVWPGDSVALRFRFAPTDSGSFTGTATLSVTSMGLTAEPQITLTGIGVRGTGILDVRSTSLQFDTASICNGPQVLYDTLRNVGCDTLFFASAEARATLSGDTGFTLLDSIPHDLLPNDSVIVRVQFASVVKGAHYDTLTISWDSGGTGKDASTHAFAYTTSGTKWLTASLASINFDSLYTCQSRDTTITLTNPGCDTLLLDSAMFAGTNGIYATNAKLPSMILPNSTCSISVTCTPSNAGTVDTLTVYAAHSDSAKQIAVPMQVRVIPPDTMQLSIEQKSESAMAGQAVKYQVLLTGAEDGTRHAMKSLSFSITNDDDLLAYRDDPAVRVDSIRAAGTPPATRTTRYYTISPVPNDSIIAQFVYDVYLAAADSTAVTLSNPSFTTSLGLPNDCVATILDSSASFTFINICSDSIMRDFLATGGIHITSIVPNPASNTVKVTVSSAGYSCELFDALGRSAACPLLEKEGEAFVLDVSVLPSGAYYLRVSSGRISGMKMFMKE